MLKFLQKILYLLAKIILLLYKPEVIGITGSVGKTSTKDAIHTVLSYRFLTRKSLKSYNNQIGVPLTIIGAETPGTNIGKWLFIFSKALKLIFFGEKNYPGILILEMGADRPGDIKYLTKLAPCKVGVITAIGEDSPVHIEFFKDIDELVREKRVLVTQLKKNAYAILNADDQNVLKMKEKTKAMVKTVGFNAKAEIYASDVILEENLTGLSYKVHFAGNVVPIFLQGCLGIGQVYASLFAVACGLIYGLNLVEISEALKKYNPPPGRMNLVPGIKNTLIIDDSYNSSPVACREALQVLKEGKARRKLACLGDMAELGIYTAKEHQAIGQLVAESNVAELYVVGEKGKLIGQEAKKTMGEGRIFSFNTAEEAGRFIQDRLQSGDLLLVKGSQCVRLEKVVKELMAEPQRAKELLVRQEDSWLK